MLKSSCLVTIIFGFIFIGRIHAQTTTVYLTTGGGYADGELWCNITTGANGTGTQVWGQGNGTLGNGAGALTNESITIDCGITLYFNTWDQWGDSWNDAVYNLTDGSSTIVNNSGSIPSGFGGFNSSTWNSSNDLETSESFTTACPCTPTISAATATPDCSSSTFDISLTITDPGFSATNVTVSDGGTNPNQVINSFPTTVTFTSYPVGTPITLNVDNGTCDLDANSVVENCNLGFGCSAAVPLFDGYTSGGTITTPGNSGVEDWVTSTDASCGSASDAGFENSDVYIYSYTTGSVAGESFYFTIDHNSSVVGEHSIGVFSNCTGGVLSGCLESNYQFDDVVGVCVQSLAANTTYYIAIAQEWYSLNGTNLNFEVVDFTVESSTTIPDDECNTASVINIADPYNGSTRCSYTASTSSPSGCGSIENDSWVAFVAGETDVIIDYSVEDCSNSDGVQFSVWSGSCGSLSMIPGSCLNYASDNSIGTWSLSGLTVGDTYYIRADGYAGDLCSYSYTPVSGILPISLTQFKGTPLSNGYNRISWATTTESNNDYFELEKSSDGVNFTAISTIDGAGNSNNTIDYMVHDPANSEITYYRLKQIDFNGNATLSRVISVTNSTIDNSLTIYPNPVNSGTITIYNQRKIENIRIINSQGNTIKIFSEVDAETINIDLTDLIPGIYHVQVYMSNQMLSKKIIIL